MKKNENNFKKAMNELLSLDMSGLKSDTQTETKVEETAPERVEPEVVETTLAHTQTPLGSAAAKPAWETVITQDVIIEGNILSGSNLKILGKVQGNVNCEGVVTLTGSVDGNVAAQSLRFQSGVINGNVSVRDNMTADKDTKIKGDIVAASIASGGHVEGNISAQNVLELRDTASVIGNIKARGISMYTGATVRGMIDVGGQLAETEEE